MTEPANIGRAEEQEELQRLADAIGLKGEFGLAAASAQPVHRAHQDAIRPRLLEQQANGNDGGDDRRPSVHSTAPLAGRPARDGLQTGRPLAHNLSCESSPRKPPR